MRSLLRRVILVFLTLVPQYSMASEVVPFSVKRLKPVGSGFIELVGPGKIRIENKVRPFEEIKYVKWSNIDTLTSENGSDKGCVLAYSSEGYAENIYVRKQSCNEILSLFSAVK